MVAGALGHYFMYPLALARGPMGMGRLVSSPRPFCPPAIVFIRLSFIVYQLPTSSLPAFHSIASLQQAH